TGKAGDPIGAATASDGVVAIGSGAVQRPTRDVMNAGRHKSEILDGGASGIPILDCDAVVQRHKWRAVIAACGNPQNKVVAAALQLYVLDIDARRELDRIITGIPRDVTIYWA